MEQLIMDKKYKIIERMLFSANEEEIDNYLTFEQAVDMVDKLNSKADVFTNYIIKEDNEI